MAVHDAHAGSTHPDPVQHHEVLLLEDDRVLGDLMERRLVRAGVLVHRFESAEDADAAACAGLCGTLVSDVHLAGDMTGIQLVERLRARGDARPTVLISGSQDRAQDEAARSAGAQEVLHKPFPLGDLVTLLESFAGTPTPDDPARN